MRNSLRVVETGVPAADAADRFAALQLARSRNVGPRTWTHLVRRFGSATAAVEALPELAARGGARGYRPADPGMVEEEWARAEAVGARLAVLGEPGYPDRLRAIDSAPATVWIMGGREVFDRPAVAIVGSRNASALGLRTARQIAGALGRAGRATVSGLARGIDTAVHDATLGSGTIAVLPGGLDVVYPPENAALAERIVDEGGALLSECAMGVEATARHFPKRNRLISGLGDGVLLIEAAARSGSLITARAALDQGREVMAVPGSPEDPRATGCNALIRDGATLVRDAEDVFEALALPQFDGLAEEAADDHFALLPPAGAVPGAALDPDRHESDRALADRVVGLLGPSPVDIDELARAARVPVSVLPLVVLELELAGRVEVGPGGRIARLPEPAPEAGR